MPDASETAKLGRRPLKSRQTRWAAEIARLVAAAGVSPNGVSIASVLFATIGAAGLYFAGRYSATYPVVSAVLYFAAIAGIQLRLLCNLIDGMVAVEYGKGTKSGEIYNDLPDRIADVMLFIAAGYAAAYAGTDWRWRPIELGWFAAVLAVSTAYVRVLGRSIGAGVHFIGPMAKQHRMALMSLACLLCLVVQIVVPARRLDGTILAIALAVVCVGSIITAIRRIVWIARDLEQKP